MGEMHMTIEELDAAWLALASKNVTISDRNKRIIVDVLVDNSTMAAAGRKYGISSTRAHQIIRLFVRQLNWLKQFQAEAEKEDREQSVSLSDLPTMAKNTLRVEGFERKDDVRAAILSGYLTPGNVQNYGAKSHAEVCLWAQIGKPTKQEISTAMEVARQAGAVVFWGGHRERDRMQQMAQRIIDKTKDPELKDYALGIWWTLAGFHPSPDPLDMYPPPAINREGQ